MVKAVIIAGFLYSEKLGDNVILIQKKVDGEVSYSISGYEKTSTDVLNKYFVNCNQQRCLLENGIYELEIDGTRQIVPVVGVYRKPTCTNEKGQPYPFMDMVYPLVISSGAMGELSILITETEKSTEEKNIPKILLDGNKEIFPVIGEKAYAYPTKIVSGNPFIIYTDAEIFDVQIEDNQIPLKHNDQLVVCCDGTELLKFTWDQISKVWVPVRNNEPYEMIAVKGGQYIMGDYRGKLYNYSFGIHNVNMKKSFENVLDPEYMGEAAVGLESVGVSGLKEEDSLAANKDSDFWCFNEDAISLHEVKVSDFYLGKYSVTMDEFYSFVNSLQEDEKGLFYMNGTTPLYIHQIAAVGLSEKRIRPRDNGWGMGTRPAVNASFNEMVEYCNWLSLKEGFVPCYEIKPICKGEYREGLSECSLFRYVDDSVMQKKASRNEMLQLVEIKCNSENNGYRLPFEAEFEYVLRGGENMHEIRGGKGELFAGITMDGTDYNDHVSWQRRNTDFPNKDGGREANLYNDNMGGNGYTSPVGTRVPTNLGFYDLSGGVWETMNDIFNRTYYEDCRKKGLVENPIGPQYSLEQLGDMKQVNSDAYFLNRYMYTYEKQADGTFTRTVARSIEASGKTYHVLRGGCFTNPLLFTSTLHRHTASGLSYIENFVNQYNARIGFRLVRKIAKRGES